VSAVTRATTLTAFRNETAAVDVRPAPAAHRSDARREVPPRLNLRIYSDLNTVEAEWRCFERVADCTAFQTFDWLAAWQRHIGARHGVRPVIAVGRFSDGDIAFILPLCVVPGPLARRLCWLGQDSCDYNAPLLARDLSQRVPPEGFLAAWHELQMQTSCEPLLRYDWIEFEKMPEKIGAQLNPFTYLAVKPNRSSAHLTRLGDDWEKFYFAKRSSATRRRDRAKRRHMSQYGDIRFTTVADAQDARHTLEILMEQKSRSLARKGIADMFAPPGRREFYRDLASNPELRHLIHISRVEIGTVCAAANLGIVFGDCYYHVLASYVDGEVAHYGPGALHLRELMAHAITRRLQRFDFTIGDEPYKLEWSDTVLKLYDYTATRTWRGLPARWFSSGRRRVKRWIKQTPALWNLASQARSAIGRCRGHPDPANAKPLSPTRLRRPKRLPASWATWICYGRWRWPTFPALSSAGRASPRSIRAMRSLAWSGMTTRTISTAFSTRWCASARRKTNRRCCSTKRTDKSCCCRGIVSAWRKRFASSSPMRRWSKICSTRRASRIWRTVTACKCRRRAASTPRPLSRPRSAFPSRSSSSR
jgi:CelD/BcsL family acetyltransferase involved in cellulose biosynthesis